VGGFNAGGSRNINISFEDEKEVEQVCSSLERRESGPSGKQQYRLPLHIVAIFVVSFFAFILKFIFMTLQSTCPS
jgi:hypothetical protein